jgi:hypothetical protein
MLGFKLARSLGRWAIVVTGPLLGLGVARPAVAQVSELHGSPSQYRKPPIANRPHPTVVPTISAPSTPGRPADGGLTPASTSGTTSRVSSSEHTYTATRPSVAGYDAGLFSSWNTRGTGYDAGLFSSWNTRGTGYDPGLFYGR